MSQKSSIELKALGAAIGLTISVVAVGGVVQPMMLSCPLNEKPVGTCYSYACNTTTGMWVRGAKLANGTPCNDDKACTTADKCSNGVCIGTAVSNVCCASGTPIATNACCSYGSPLTDTSCNDGNACTQSDSCQAGACVGSNPVDSANCASSAGACRFTTNRTSYCYDKAGNVTAMLARVPGNTCVQFSCP